MSTPAQIAANQANTELSSGPKTEEGKAASSRNHTSHGLTYRNIFFILPCESGEAYSILLADLHHEHRPDTETERILVDRMAQHHWLRCRAEGLESGCFREDGTINEKGLALYMRYRTSHERAFHKCLAELLKLRTEKRKTEIGFESQKRVKDEHSRKQEKHQMAKDRHKWDVLLAEAKVDHQVLRTMNRDTDVTQQLIAAEKAKQAA